VERSIGGCTGGNIQETVTSQKKSSKKQRTARHRKIAFSPEIAASNKKEMHRNLKKEAVALPEQKKQRSGRPEGKSHFTMRK